MDYQPGLWALHTPNFQTILKKSSTLFFKQSSTGPFQVGIELRDSLGSSEHFNEYKGWTHF